MLSLQLSAKFLQVVLISCLVYLNTTEVLSEPVDSARVLKNNALKLNNERFILYGAVIPTSTSKCSEGESLWPCGARATLTLHSLLQDELLNCESIDNSSKLPLVRCYVGASDIAQLLINDGLAIVPKVHSEYRLSEISAKSRQVGIWRGGFSPPQEWRDYPTLSIDPIAELMCSECAVRKQ